MRSLVFCLRFFCWKSICKQRAHLLEGILPSISTNIPFQYTLRSLLFAGTNFSGYNDSLIYIAGIKFSELVPYY